MSSGKRLLVNATPNETRVALLEDGLVMELFIERTRKRGIAGNIYKGRVRKILPGMQSAFVDIGLEKDAFLYVADIAVPAGADDKWSPGDSVDEGLDGNAVPPVGTTTRAEEAIDALLEEGEEIVVQIAKEPIAGKGARVTAHVTLPGRYVVYMPTVRHVGVSRRIDSEVERTRLKEVMQRLRDETGAGFIVRTAGEGASSDELEADARYYKGLWDAIGARIAASRAPALVHAELGLLDKLLRDVVAGEFVEILLDSEADFQMCVERLTRVQPDLAQRVGRHTDPTPIFEVYGIEAEIEKALRSKVWLKSGGYIVINQTEALVAIDVNTGRYVGKVRLEDTVLRTNLEAVKEIVRQVRLRDLGGIIVVDFIDMEEAENRVKVVAELESELRRDRSKSKILQISDFGLVEMTRKRVKGSLERLLCRPCTSCAGSGRVKSAETICYEIQRELLRSHATLPSGDLAIRVHPEVAAALAGSERVVLEQVERDLGRRVQVTSDAALHVERYEVLVP